LIKIIEERRNRARVRTGSATAPWPRVANLMLGIWLQVSIFAWPHSDPARLSAWFPGLLISIVSLLSLGAPPMRWLNAFLSLWLIIWTFTATGGEPLAYLNGVVCGLLVLVFAAIPSRSAAHDFRD
jgi:hypothetical protein